MTAKEEFNLSEKIQNGNPSWITSKNVKEFIRLVKKEFTGFYPKSSNETTMKKVYLLLEPYYEIIDKLAGKELI